MDSNYLHQLYLDLKDMCRRCEKSIPENCVFKAHHDYCASYKRLHSAARSYFVYYNMAKELVKGDKNGEKTN